MIKRFSPLFIIYVLVSGPSGDHVRSYDGQSTETITSLLANEGKTGEVIIQKQYETFIDDHKPVPPDTSVRDQAILDAKNQSKTDAERIDALIKAIDLR